MPWRNDREDRRRSDAAYGDPVYRRNRRAAWNRAGGRCEKLVDGRRCGSTRRCQVDHITPISQHGTHHLDNLRVLCGFHHAEKTAQEGGGFRRGKPKSDPPLQQRTAW